MREKGPGLLLELSVRIYSFPEDVHEPLRELTEMGLVGIQAVAGGQFGAELYLLTPAGERVLAMVSDPAFQRETVAPASAPSIDTRQQQAELLNKLGDAAKQSGDLQKAIEYYEKALDLTRELAANFANPGGGK